MRNSHRFSIKDYYHLAEVGILHPKSPVELLDGQIIDHSRITPLHTGTMMILGGLLGFNSDDWFTIVRGEVVLDEYSQLQPDLMMVKPREDSYCSRHPVPEDVFLLIELSDLTLDFIREQKLPAYGRASIKEVWIVNLNESTIEVYREPHFTGYASKTILRPGDKAAPQAFPDVAVDVGELLRR